ncbi:MAG: GIY-YIG nuclease family protein, partial [Prevotella sp.]|nr:GIY-YIG nuclease family protein [Prevotella sp.]
MATTQNYFPRKSESAPMIYAYEDKYDPQLSGLLKVGYTTIGVQERVHQQYNIVRPGEPPYRIVVEASAMRQDGTTFTDHDVHRQLVRMGCQHAEGEWYRCTPQQVKAAIVAVRERIDVAWTRDKTFGMRPEQLAAVEKTAAYFESYKAEAGRVPHFLWNCKMRFGKTFTTYQLALRMGWRRVLVLTFKPAVAHAWEEDLMTHADFSGWQFIARSDEATIDSQFEQADKSRPMVVFGSFQDFLGKNTASGGMKLKHEWARAFNWDCIVLDEYHYGAWRENAKDLIGVSEDLGSEMANPDYFDEDMIPITANHYLYLSGTPFRAIASGEFIEEQIYNWTYSDEQRAKEEWSGKGDNPYAPLPKMVLLTYQLPAEIARVAEEGEFDEFDLNSFFEAEGKGDDAVFKHHDEVQKWLDMLRGQYLPTSVSDLRTGNRRPPLPFLHGDLYSNLNHTLWFLPNVAACFAMRNLLTELQNTFYHDYRVVVCAGTRAGIGQQALPPVEQAMAHPDPLHCKTITLTCGKLTTGVTVRPWTGIFMLRDTSSPETYFQSAFRVQSPWTIANSDGLHPNRVEILKKVCYVFDFSPNRALRKVADYSCQLNVEEGNPERCVEDFIRFLPVLCYENGVMKALSASDVLDMAMSNTSATLLARRWESALLVNVDNFTLQRLINNEQAMRALMKIEGFR